MHVLLCLCAPRQTGNLNVSGVSGGRGELTSDMERVRHDIAAQTQYELNLKLQEVNAYLEGQAEQRSKLDRLRDNTDSEIRREFEQTKKQLLVSAPAAGKLDSC